MHINSELRLTTQVGKVVSSCSHQLRHMKFARKSLPIEAIINAFVVSRKDYCNGLLTGHMFYSFHRLHKVLNGAARLLYVALTFSHVTPLLRDKLQWLKCREESACNQTLCDNL